MEHILREAIRYARGNYPLKSTNKRYQDISRLSLEKQAFYSEAMDQKRKHILRYMRYKAMKEFSAYSKEVTIRKYNKIPEAEREPLVGNCLEMASSAYCWLIDHYPRLRSYQTKPDLLIVGLGPPYDHSFVMIGSGFNSDLLPVAMSSYPPDTWVCDPWANIVCRVIHYPDEWRRKLHKWSDRGKELVRGTKIVVQHGEITFQTQWGDPMIWVPAIAMGTKHVIEYFQGY